MNVNDIRTNLSKKYVYSLIEFNCEILIDERLSGRCIEISTNDNKMFAIYFPFLVFDRENGISKMISPLRFSTTNLDTSYWGSLLSYTMNNDDKVTEKLIGISAIWIISEKHDKEWIKTLKPSAEWFVRCIQAISPESVLLKGTDSSQLISGTSHSYFNEKTGRNSCSGFEIPLTVYRDYPVRVNLKIIQHIFRNFGKNIVLPYELLLGAYQSFNVNNFRNTILNCAMTIEVALKHRIRSSLSAASTNEKINNHLIKSADGLPKIEQLMKLVNLEKLHDSKIQYNVFNIRNSIIHGGLCPTREQAALAIQLSKQTLNQYSINYFD